MTLAVNLNILELMLQYLPKEQALEVAKKLTIEEYRARQSLKETIMRELEAVSKPQYGTGGNFWPPIGIALPLNTLDIVSQRFDYQRILDTPFDEIEFVI